MDIYESIVSTLEGQLVANHRLLELSVEKTGALRKNATADLLRIASEEESLAREIISLEKQRAAFLGALPSPIEDTGGLLALSRRHAAPGVEEALTRLSGELRACLAQLKEQNALNQSLLELVLDQIEVAKNLLYGPSEPRYPQTPRPAPGSGPELFDEKF